MAKKNKTKKTNKKPSQKKKKVGLNTQEKTIIMVVLAFALIGLVYFGYTKVDEILTSEQNLLDVKKEDLAAKKDIAGTKDSLIKRQLVANEAMNEYKFDYYPTTYQEEFILKLQEIQRETSIETTNISFTQGGALFALSNEDREGKKQSKDQDIEDFNEFVKGVKNNTVNYEFETQYNHLMKMLQFLDNEERNKKIIISNLSVSYKGKPKKLSFISSDMSFLEVEDGGDMIFSNFFELERYIISTNPQLTCKMTINFVEVPDLDNFLTEEEKPQYAFPPNQNTENKIPFEMKPFSN